MRAPPPGLPVVALVVLAIACDESPTQPTEDPERASFAEVSPIRAPSLDDRFAAMVDEIPGFAGMYVGPSGELVIRVASESEAAIEPPRDAVSAEFPSLRPMAMRVERAEHDYAALNAWKRSAAPVLALDGVVSLDLDESRGKIVLGVLDSAARVRALTAALEAGVPEDAVEVEVEEPVVLAGANHVAPFTSLSFRFRPLRAGFRIMYGPNSSNVCTLGFLAKIDEGDGEVRVALINSHCTALEAQLDVGFIYQSSWATSGHGIGNEGRDPPAFSCVQNPNKGCRNSDAALVSLGSSLAWDFPYIARTNASDQFNGSTIVSSSQPRFRVVSEGPLMMGMTLSKIGITTGWTTGTVSATCKTVTPTLGPVTFTRLCNGEVQAGSGGGDSGSPVFRELGEVEGEPTVELHGLEWGGNQAGTVFLFSTLINMRADLGLFTVFDGQIAPF